MTQQKLRYEVIKALEFLANSHPDGYPAEIWMDGLGEVVECFVQPSSNIASIDAVASEVESADDSNFKIVHHHPVDYHYRNLDSQEDERDCVYSDLSQLFPFPGSLFETHRYLEYAASRITGGDIEWMNICLAIFRFRADRNRPRPALPMRCA